MTVSDRLIPLGSPLDGAHYCMVKCHDGLALVQHVRYFDLDICLIIQNRMTDSHTTVVDVTPVIEEAKTQAKVRTLFPPHPRSIVSSVGDPYVMLGGKQVLE